GELRGMMRDVFAIATMGVVLLVMGRVGAAAGADRDGWYPAATPPAEMLSLRRTAAVTIGGEIRVDYTYRSMPVSRADPKTSLRVGDLSVRQANLRIVADVHPSLRAIFKLDASANGDPARDRDEILEEALVVMRAVGGTGLGFFAGKGRAPYGQDVTLGMIQNYHHAANRADSAEGRIFIVEPPDATGTGLAPMRPGQIDRAGVAGAAYEWDERWRVEAAVFQPHSAEYRERFRDRTRGRTAADVGAAGRLWLRPVEELTLEASVMLARSAAMARTHWRIDVPSDAAGRNKAYALSLGFDWRQGDWRLYGEYSHGWDWNFTKGYATDAWQIGLARDLTVAWRVGAVVEGLRIRDPAAETVDNYYRLAFHVRYQFPAGAFLLAEYGHEWFRRRGDAASTDRRRGDLVGLRVGFSF
ncbi:MAG: hypothetical protein LIP77_06920, partial [Planctomycetes bacterium]|nr:hypothetical protein [Planctomycetota bacterium]